MMPGTVGATVSIKDSNKNPIAGAYVVVRNPDTGTTRFGKTTDTSGAFSKKIGSGTYRLLDISLSR